jgi:hypothetical protein
MKARAIGITAGIILLAALPGAVFAQLEPSEVELEDVIEIEVLGRELLAYDLLGTSTLNVRLEIGESLIWKRASGRIGLVMTDRRALAVTPRSAGWHEVRWGVHEVAPSRGFIGKRVSLIVTSHRILGYDSGSRNWFQQELGPHEKALKASVGASTAAVVTDRTAYGLSPDSGGFFGTPMEIHEELRELRVSSNMATVTTTKRLLVFRAPVGVWSEQNRPLHGEGSSGRGW